MPGVGEPLGDLLRIADRRASVQRAADKENRDVRLHRRTEVVTEPRHTLGDFGGDRFSLSPDGGWVASVNSGEDGVTGDIRLLPVEGGPARVIWSTEPPDALGRFVAWTPDGEALIVWKRVVPDTKNGMATLWIVPLDGSAPIESELRADYPYFFPLSIHPDGRRVAYSTGKTIREIWVLRNLSFGRREASE